MAAADPEACPENAYLLEAEEEEPMDGIFINAEHPIGCNGIVVAWHFCYYTDDDASERHTYTANFAVYEQEGMHQSAVYERVVGSYVQVSISGDEMASIGQDFVCENLQLSRNQWFNVTENLVIGVCVSYGPQDNSDDDDDDDTGTENTVTRRSLSLVAKDLNRYSLQHGSLTSCLENSTVSVASALTSRLNRRTIHVSVEVRKLFFTVKTVISFSMHVHSMRSYSRFHTWTKTSKCNLHALNF